MRSRALRQFALTEVLGLNLESLYFTATILASTSALKVTNPQSLVTGRVFDSATFAYYGPQTKVMLNSSGIVLKQSSRCTFDLDSVEGKIVIVGDWWPLLSATSECGATHSLGDIYGAINYAGASALIYVSHLDFFPVGSLTFHFETWDKCRFCNASTLLVHVSSDVLSVMDDWLEQPELKFDLNPASHHVYRSLFYSTWWTLCYRVVLPTVAFATSTEASLGLYRVRTMMPRNEETDGNRYVALAVCCIEAPCMLLMGLSSLLGLYGPYAIPTQVANMMYAGFQGAGILTNILLGLHLADACKIVKNEGRERRPIFEEYRNFLTAVSVCTLGADVVAMVLSILCYYLVHRFKIVSLFFVVFYTAMQGAAGLFFISYARTVQQPMLEYLKNAHQIGTKNLQSRRKIGHLVFWLTASAVIMILTSIGMITFSILMSRGLQNSGVDMWPYAVFYIVFARVLVSAAQVHAIRPVEADTLLSLLLKLLLLRPIECFLKIIATTFRSRASVVPSAPGEALISLPGHIHESGSYSKGQLS